MLIGAGQRSVLWVNLSVVVTQHCLHLFGHKRWILYKLYFMCIFQGWLNVGNKHRATASTAMNDKSSRSHSVFTMVLTQTKVFHHIHLILHFCFFPYTLYILVWLMIIHKNDLFPIRRWDMLFIWISHQEVNMACYLSRLV